MARALAILARVIRNANADTMRMIRRAEFLSSLVDALICILVRAR